MKDVSIDLARDNACSGNITDVRQSDEIPERRHSIGT